MGRSRRVSRFIDWRDAEPSYQAALKEVLARREACDSAPTEEASAAAEALWRAAWERLRALEAALLLAWEARIGRT